MRFLSTCSQNELAGKKCLIRTNLDIANPHDNSFRIIKALPTIQFLLDHGAHPVILSHRGRPEKQEQSFSLQPAIAILEEKLSSIYGSSTSIDWRENLRFDPREENNNEEFAKELAHKADIYINDDFAASHRQSASLVAITKYLPSYAGLLLEEEIKNLSAARDNPAHPLVLIVGGIKIEDKLRAIETLRTKADAILFGSAYNTEHPASQDISAETIQKYVAMIQTAKTIIWNGPLGNIENSAHTKGTEAIAQAIIQSKAFSLVGGGDTVEFLAQRHILDTFGFISTGGGAMLAFLGNKPMPALEALEKTV